jgi:hypothetical protein
MGDEEDGSGITTPYGSYLRSHVRIVDTVFALEAGDGVRSEGPASLRSMVLLQGRSAMSQSLRERSDAVIEENAKRVHDIGAIHDALFFSRDLAMTPKNPLPLYTGIADKYGNMDRKRFHALHAEHKAGVEKVPVRIIDHMSAEGSRELPPLTEREFLHVLEKNRRRLLDRYTEEFRKKALGGCEDIATDFKSVVDRKFKRYDTAVKIYVSGHVFNVVNVDGVLYALDFAFNQFTENTHFANWNRHAMESPTVGLLVYPVGRAGSKSQFVSPRSKDATGPSIEALKSAIIDPEHSLPAEDESLRPRPTLKKR